MMDGLFAFGFLALFFLGPPFLVGLAVGWFARGRKEQAATHLALHEARRLDGLVEQIRHDAYEHMTLDSRLAPIIVDTIRTSDLERQRTVAASKAVPPPYGQAPYGQAPYGQTPYGGGAPQGQAPRYGPGEAGPGPEPRVAPPYPPASGWTEEK